MLRIYLLLIAMTTLFSATSFSQTAFFSEFQEISIQNELAVFTDFASVDESKILLINNRTRDYSVKLLDRNSNVIVNEFARSGRGPGEIDQIGSYTLDDRNEFLYITDYNGLKIKTFSIEGEVIDEQPFDVLNVISLTHSGSTLVASNVIQVNSTETEYQDKRLSTLVDANTLDIIGTLYFDPNNLNLNDRIDNFQRLDFVQLYPTTIQVQNNLYVVVFENINKVFLINSDSEIVHRIEIPIPGYQLPRVVYNPDLGYGYRPSKIFYDVEIINDSIVLAFGDRLTDIPFGVAKISLEDNNLAWSLYRLYDSDRFQQEQFQITSHDNTILSFDGEEFIQVEFEKFED